MTTGTLPAGITVNTATGITAVAPNTPVGSYQSVTIFEVNNPTNCSTVTSNIVVSSATISAAADSPRDRTRNQHQRWQCYVKWTQTCKTAQVTLAFYRKRTINQ
jgi:hypothetical protein